MADLNDLIANWAKTTQSVVTEMKNSVSNGTSGTSGSSGVSGSQGQSGSNGTSGSSGVSIESQAINPERFGAKSNVFTYEQAVKNTQAIRKCGFEYGKIDLQPGVYKIANDIRISSNTTIKGASGQTVISPIAESAEVFNRGTNDEWFSVFNTNTGPGARVGDVPTNYGDSNNVSIQDLVIDCGFSSQKRTSDGKYPTTTEAIFLQGANNKVNNVTVINAARGVGGGECFIIRLAFGPNTLDNSKGGEITNCDISNVGFAAASHGDGGGCEISCLTVSGYGSKKAYGINISGNKIHDIPIITGKQNSPINSISCSASVGARIQNNDVINVDGNGFYTDNWENEGMLIQNNNFHNVVRGIFLNAYGDSYTPASLGIKNSLISQNNIFLRNGAPQYVVGNPYAGIVINSPINEYNKTWIENLLIQSNVIRGYGSVLGNAAPEPFFARGIYFIFARPNQYKKVCVANNIIDTPDTKQSVYYPSAGCLSMYFWGPYDTYTSELTHFGNKNMSGSDLKLMICKPDYTLNRFI